MFRHPLVQATRILVFSFLFTESVLAQQAPSKPSEVADEDLPVDDVPVTDDGGATQESPPRPGASPAPQPPTSEDPKTRTDAGVPVDADAAAAEAEAAEAEAAEAEAAEAEAAEEEAALLDSERPDRPAPKGKAVIWGTIRGAVDKEPLPEASVSVVGTKWKTVADYEGRYRLELPPGNYTLRFFYELHQPALIKDVTVKAQQLEQLDATVIPDEAAVETFEVETQADKSSVEGQVLARQRSAAVGDGVGRAEISKTPATNAAQAAQRVVGATVVGDRFIYVRGLGERYTNALLNDAPLPSPEPDRAAIPLDLFPSLILDNINIVKTFLPDMPGDFAGGSVRIQTRELPSKPVYQLSLKLSGNDRSTFRERWAQRGSSTDFLGFDSGQRGLPSALRNASLPTLSPEEQQQALADVNSYMSPKKSLSPVDYAVSGVLGNGWDLGRERRIGALLTVNYGRGFGWRDDQILRSYRVVGDAPNRELRRSTDYRGEYGVDRVNWGTLGSVSFWPARNHRISLIGLRTQIADSSAHVVRGYNDGLGGEIGSTRLAYVTRALTMGQLRGEHEFPSLSNAKLDWNATIARATRYEPNTRDTVFLSVDGGRYNASTVPENGAHFYADQGETTRGAGLDWTQPISKLADATKFKLGALVSVKTRDFWAKRYSIGATQGNFFHCGDSYSATCSDSIYTADNIRNGRLAMTETTLLQDAYDATLDVYSGYVMGDIGLSSSLRLVGGARIEATRQTIDPVSQFADVPAPAGSALKSTDVLPSVGLIYSATKRVKVRFTAARTLARPQIRELSPFTFADYFGGRTYGGNPNLKLTEINNGDLRFEYYPTQSEVAAFSFFFKDFRNPIENIILDTGPEGTLQPYNTPGAKLVGVEFEARKNLGFLSQAMRDLTLIGNLTLSRSTINVNLEESTILVTNRSRPMVNQAPFVVNLALDYAHEASGFGARVLYNVAGKRIVEVGTRGMQDSYEHSRHLLDLTLSQKFAKRFDLRFVATNLIGSRYRVTVGSKNDDELILRGYREPRVFSLVGTYTH